MIHGLELQALPAKPAQQPQRPVEAFPVLCNSAGSKACAVIQGTPNGKAAQLWGSLTKQMTSACQKMVIDCSENKRVQRAEAVRIEASSGKNRKRWTPLQF